MNQDDLKRFKDALETERKRLEISLSGVAKKDPENSSNWNATFPQLGENQNASSSMLEESADEVEEFETRLETGDALEHRLGEVNRALQRIVAGTYGQCERCGASIPMDRLEANPAAEFDIEHSE